MAEPNTTYKLTILFLLDRLENPFSNTQLTNFFLDTGYSGYFSEEKEHTGYFTIQSVINDLLESGLILVTEKTVSDTLYRITQTGRETLHAMEDKLTDGLKKDATDYLQAHGNTITQENSLLANYYRTTAQNYAVRLQYRKKNEPLIDLTITVPNKDAAEAACKHWHETNGDVYSYLLELLVP